MSPISESPFSPEQIAAERLKPEEYEEIVQRLGRHPNKAELGMFGVMWSEHCCYKNSRPLLKQFPTEGDRILVGPGENAGVVDLETACNSPSKLNPTTTPQQSNLSKVPQPVSAGFSAISSQWGLAPSHF